MARLKQIGIDVDVNGVIERHRRAFSESENDILRRILFEPRSTPAADSVPPVSAPLRPPATRNRGLWTVELLGQRHSAPNLKGAYKILLLELYSVRPEFLKHFAQERGRSRRYVARSPAHLYLATPGLAKDYAEPLVDGWFFDTNLSTQQVGKRARAAARVAGLRYGKDLRILNNLEEI